MGFIHFLICLFGVICDSAAGQNLFTPSSITGHSNQEDDQLYPYKKVELPIIKEINLQRVGENHKPIFHECIHYRPSIKEEEPEGTQVLVVRALDKDPLSNGGKVTYTFILAPGDKSKFAIDKSTGVITTKHVFDRDEPKHEKETYITVRATDNGKPQLDDVCTIRVIVEDVNDNSPIFDKVSYKESIPQDFLPGQEAMRVSATDIDDGNNSKVTYRIDETLNDYPNNSYFIIDSKTGVIFLNQIIDKDPGYVFHITIVATDCGEIPNSQSMPVYIEVVESDKKLPVFTRKPISPVTLLENFKEFTFNIATFSALSNDNEKPLFELLIGRTEQTNKDSTFRLESDGNDAYVRLARHLDYETNSEYTLTVRVENKYNMAAESNIKILIEDVNDNIPSFAEVKSGIVSENEPPGTYVMQVQAVDEDGSPENNQITYELADNKQHFEINSKTGDIITKVMFDREKQDVYNVKVIATDNSPSTLYDNGNPNKGEQVFRIEIADKNDNFPKFERDVYVSKPIPEDVNINRRVIKVKALDIDTASTVTYTIVSGNIGDAFGIEDKTGEIYVNNHLDYEQITEYVLRIKAFDGLHNDFCHVKISIENVNDNRPVFNDYPKDIIITEETLYPDCIGIFSAYDPDIKSKTLPQHIVYYIVKREQRSKMNISSEGCLYLIGPLDRDPPDGFEKWQVLIAASDEDGEATSLSESIEVVITLKDINDNEPYLDMKNPVIWQENKPPDVITELIARDNDGPENGPPFVFSFAPSVSTDIKQKFMINEPFLSAKVSFDREEIKSYLIPISIADSGHPSLTGTSTLLVIIGDENDNQMQNGHSEIFVYNYKGQLNNIEIGRVYVRDSDDWDLPYKTFRWHGTKPQNFKLNEQTGMITMSQASEDELYKFQFRVKEKSSYFAENTALATVNVWVKQITDEAVDKSGSLRLENMTSEKFIEKDQDGISIWSQFRQNLGKYFNVSVDNIDIFTILHSPYNNNKQLDIRLSVHGSPYYSPEKINAVISKHKTDLEIKLNISIILVNIDECLIERKLCEEDCTNFLNKTSRPYIINTNTTSFIGVYAVTVPVCKCENKDLIYCYNNGIISDVENCKCKSLYLGAGCREESIGFSGDGWALYPPLEYCSASHISLFVRTNDKNGLLLYSGPTIFSEISYTKDFISLEIINGYLSALLDFGTGTVKLLSDTVRLDDGMSHKIDLFWTKETVEVKIDNCDSCVNKKRIEGQNKLLNINGPLQLGGSFINFSHFHNYIKWNYIPSTTGFRGCISNFTFNNKQYNLGMVSFSENISFGCDNNIFLPVKIKIGNFLISFSICLLLLLFILLLLVIVRYKRKPEILYDSMSDTRDNIINYEEEGGGEADIPFIDLTLLKVKSDDIRNIEQHDLTPHNNDTLLNELNQRKEIIDSESFQSNYLTHYNYEGEGSTAGTLSSLVSETEDEDLNFDYISKFGPRFECLDKVYRFPYNSDSSEDNSDIYI